jgi:hypothetical protein
MLCIIPATQAQRILIVEKPGKFKNFKYFVGSDISLRILPAGNRVSGIIHEITDSSILINYDNEIMLSDIERVIKNRWGFSLLSKVTRISGAGYFVIDALNSVITGNPTIVTEKTAIISGSLVAFSYVLVPLHSRPLKKGKWRIKILNMSMDEEVPNPFQQ